MLATSRSNKFKERGGGSIYHEQSPEGVVEEDDRGSHKHGGAYKFVKLRYADEAMLAVECPLLQGNNEGKAVALWGHTIVRNPNGRNWYMKEREEGESRGSKARPFENGKLEDDGS